MSNTKIEWTDKVWNPVTGCTKVSAGCKNCYAERLFHRAYPDRAFTDVRVHPDRLDQPFHWKKPCRIFVNSMSDLFHESVPDDFIDAVFMTMAQCDPTAPAKAPQDIFQILTKRPDRMLEFIREIQRERDWIEGVFPLSNVWLGVSIEDQATADERIPLLLQTPAAVRFVSYEPALGPVNFARYLAPHYRGEQHLNWLIAGGESGPNTRPAHPDWFRGARELCISFGIAYFFKQWGEWQDGSGSRDHELCVYADGRSCALTQEAIIEEEKRSGKMHNESHGVVMSRVGKKRAGRLLDGREWNEFPSPRDEAGA
jgi:protein gp37